MRMIRRSGMGPRRVSRGFSLIEVLVTLVVLAVGLLGVAMMQMTSMRFTQSANQRTIATNLAYELIDLARSNRLLSSRYVIAEGAFGEVESKDCAPGEDGSADANLARWKCRVHTSLPNGSAVVELPGNGVIRVTLSWTDAHWESVADLQTTEFEVESRL